MQPTKVLIVDDHALFRQGVRNAIEREEDIEVVGEAGDGAEALVKARELKPDLILMDIHMPHVSGLEAVSAIKRELPEVRIIMLTVHDKDENLFEAIKRGAEGFLSKNVRHKELLDSLRGVMRGQATISRRMAGKILQEFARLAEIESRQMGDQLSPREKEVLQKISEELSNREIGLALSISENTVKSYVTNILRKLHLQTRFQAAAYARRWGLDTYDKSAELRRAVDRAIKDIKELRDLERIGAYNNNTVLGRAMDRLEYMTSGIAHDLMEPLIVAQNTLDELSEVSSPAIRDKDIARCKDRLDYALFLVNRLISVTSCGELEIRTKPSLTGTLELVLSLIESKFQSAVPIDVSVEPKNLEIQGKDSDLQQVIFCLLENAIEATPAGGKVRVIVEGNSTDCHIRILDVGSGIKEPSEPLYSLGHTTKSRSDHAGLGLFVCKRIVTQYSGKISLSNRTDTQGVIASVVLPQKFKQRKTEYKIEDVEKDLQKHRLSLKPRDEDASRNLVTQILTAFADNLSSIVEDGIESVISPMLKQITQHADEKQVSLLQTVLRNCAYARAVVGSLLEPSQPTQVQPIHLRTGLSNVLRLFETKLPEKSVSLSVDNEIWVRADQTQFQRVFINLTRNALEAMRQDEFTLSVEARVEDDFAMIHFRDNGVGIPEENTGKIFDDGFSTKEKGRGVGLFFAKTIIEQHQGRIEVQSEVGVGTCFTIYWPVVPQPADSVTPYPLSDVLTGQALVKLEEPTDGVATHFTATPEVSERARILIIEDDRYWLDDLARRLDSPHYTIRKTRKARQAIKLIRENRYDLVLLDWRMPGISGQGVLEAVQEANPDTPVIILSAYGDAEQRTRAFQLGARAFIDKPRDRKQWDALRHKVFEIAIGK